MQLLEGRLHNSFKSCRVEGRTDFTEGELESKAFKLGGGSSEYLVTVESKEREAKVSLF